MTPTRTPQWRPRAWQDVEEQAVSLGSAGQAFIDVVHETTQLLCDYPELGGVVETTNSRLFGIRAKLVSGFRRFVVFYRDQGKTIEVVRVLGGGRDTYAMIDAES
jgi:plasmid stabilization system protein ParE